MHIAKQYKKLIIMLGIKGAIKDIQNYREWITTIKREQADSDSEYNKYGFDHNYTYMIYLVLTLGHEEAQLSDKIKKALIVEKIAPVNRYLDEHLNFAEYLVPEFNQILNPEGEPTLSYVIAYRFAFKTIGLGWIIKRLLLLSGLIFIVTKVHWTNVYEIISSWI